MAFTLRFSALATSLLLWGSPFSTRYMSTFRWLSALRSPLISSDPVKVPPQISYFLIKFPYISEIISVKAIFDEYEPSFPWVTYFLESNARSAGLTVPGDIPVSPLI